MVDELPSEFQVINERREAQERMAKGVELVERAKDWREDDTEPGSGTVIELICDMEAFIRDWLVVGEDA